MNSASTINNATIAFIGGGNMATSLIGGLVAKGVPPQSIHVSDPIEASRQQLETTFSVTTTDNNAHACAQADIIVLAVKPQIMKTVATALSGFLPHNPVVVSIAAGIPLNALQKWLGEQVPLIRCMPNTPALVHSGATGLYASPRVSDIQQQLANDLFSAVGAVAWVGSESEIDAVTALSGSGPAYFFLLMEAMEKTAAELGLSTETARLLTLQTALGAATMALKSDVSTAELRRRVTSPGGTTASAIDTFLAGKLPELTSKAMTAALIRAEEMAREFSQ